MFSLKTSCRFRSPGIWSCVGRKYCLEFPTSVTFSLWVWRRRPYSPLKHLELFTEQHCVTSKKTWILINIAVRTSNLQTSSSKTNVSLCSHYAWHTTMQLIVFLILISFKSHSKSWIRMLLIHNIYIIIFWSQLTIPFSMGSVSSDISKFSLKFSWTQLRSWL
jgi:hypothetical protein